MLGPQTNLVWATWKAVKVCSEVVLHATRSSLLPALSIKTGTNFWSRIYFTSYFENEENIEIFHTYTIKKTSNPETGNLLNKRPSHRICEPILRFCKFINFYIWLLVWSLSLAKPLLESLKPKFFIPTDRHWEPSKEIEWEKRSSDNQMQTFTNGLSSEDKAFANQVNIFHTQGSVAQKTIEKILTISRKNSARRFPICGRNFRYIIILFRL